MVFLWCCGGVFVVVFVWAVFLWCCFCGGVVFLWWCGGVIKDCHQTSPKVLEVMAVFKDCQQRLPKVLLKCWLRLKIVLKHRPKFC